MKRLVLILFATAVTAACSRSIKIDVSGQLHNSTASTIYLIAETPQLDTLAEAKVDADSRFHIECNVKQPTTAFLCDDNGTALAMFLTESAPLTMRPADTGGYVVEGGPMNDKYNLTIHQLSGLATQLMHIDHNAATAEEEYESLTAKYHEALATTITYNLDNIIGVELFINQEAYGMTAEDMRVRFAQFSPEMQALPEMQQFAKYIDVIERCQVGNKFVDAEIETITGEKMPLSAICGKGKWVLLSFWATWNEPSLRELAVLNELYSEYALMGFEICSVSLDADVDYLREYVARNNMLWYNIINKAEDETQSIAESYGVHRIPANFLISPSGEIVARDLYGKHLSHELQHRVVGDDMCTYPQLH